MLKTSAFFTIFATLLLTLTQTTQAATVEITYDGTTNTIDPNDWGSVTINIAKTTSTHVDYAGTATIQASILNVGWKNSGTLDITGEGHIRCTTLNIGGDRANANGTLDIFDGGLLEVTGNVNVNHGGQGGVINIRHGGMLEVGGNATDSIADFLKLSVIKIENGGAIQYMKDDDSAQGWSWDNISNLTTDDEGSIYTLTYDDSATTLTVMPEPATMSLLAIGSIGLLTRRRRRKA